MKEIKVSIPEEIHKEIEQLKCTGSIEQSSEELLQYLIRLGLGMVNKDESEK
mgnify:CR=1 FL=1